MSTQGNNGSGPGGFNGTLVPITVTPLFQKGPVVACDIDPPQNLHAGGHIKLSKNTNYILQFNLAGGTPGGIGFRPDKNGSCDAFWSDPNDCPRNQTNDPNYSPTRNSGTQVTVNVTAPGQDSCVNYRLNFDNNGYFDPVIIHQ